MTDLPLEVSVTDAAAALRNATAVPLLLDCRTADEHQTAHIEAAVLISMQELPDRVGELTAHLSGDKARPVIVHCHHGMRSLRVTKWLRDQGFSQAQSMAGGIDAWSEQVDPSVPRY
ncbi:MAG: rhodanese [Planctomycetia bacterium]|nr:rhodanese [Planctomycetia bacterium]